MKYVNMYLNIKNSVINEDQVILALKNGKMIELKSDKVKDEDGTCRQMNWINISWIQSYE